MARVPKHRGKVSYPASELVRLYRKIAQLEKANDKLRRENKRLLKELNAKRPYTHALLQKGKVRAVRFKMSDKRSPTVSVAEEIIIRRLYKKTGGRGNGNTD